MRRSADRSIDLGVTAPPGHRRDEPHQREDHEMRFMLLQNYGEVESGCPPMSEWSPADVQAHIEFQNVLNQELTERGELVDAQALAGPDVAKFVVSPGADAGFGDPAHPPRLGGLTTREIAAAFLVPEATMGQRISRAKARIVASDVPFALPSPDERSERLRSVLHVLYLLFYEGYVSNDGPDLARTDLSEEAIRLARQVHASLPNDPEVAGLLALMLLNDARRGARTGADGELVSLGEQDRARWDRGAITEGVALITAALRQGPIGEYQVQAAIAAVHDQAVRYEDTNWREIVALYGLPERMAPNPMVPSTAPSPPRCCRVPRRDWRRSTVSTTPWATITGSTRCTRTCRSRRASDARPSPSSEPPPPAPPTCANGSS
jgi:hypothetical protein